MGTPETMPPLRHYRKIGNRRRRPVIVIDIIVSTFIIKIYFFLAENQDKIFEMHLARSVKNKTLSAKFHSCWFLSHPHRFPGYATGFLTFFLSDSKFI